MTVRSAAVLGRWLAAGILLLGCGSVGTSTAPDGARDSVISGVGGSGGAGTGGAGTGGSGVAGAGGAGAGGSGGAGTGGAGTGGSGGPLRVTGTIDAVGAPAASGALRIINAGLAYSRTRVCSTAYCVSGGLTP
jgi:hypothetical protein